MVRRTLKAACHAPFRAWVRNALDAPGQAARAISWDLVYFTDSPKATGRPKFFQNRSRTFPGWQHAAGASLLKPVHFSPDCNFGQSTRRKRYGVPKNERPRVGRAA